MFHEIRREIRAGQTSSQQQRCGGEKGLRTTEFGRLFTYHLGQEKASLNNSTGTGKTNGTEQRTIITSQLLICLQKYAQWLLELCIKLAFLNQ